MTAPKWMPPLPQSHFRVCLAPYTTGIAAPTPMVDGYTADQMRQAQADAARAALEQAAKHLEGGRYMVIDPFWTRTAEEYVQSLRMHDKDHAKIIRAMAKELK